MCEANLYMLNKDGEEELLLESVDKLIPREDGILLENIFSQRKIIKGKIKEMKLVDHKIIIEKE
ncbi:CooT family nickel-binding protein [uncultured Clostridium sp.]|uniref:CooT family nickel-binding protein n=1 Tax=uncultured Clostridium sp. TaxID=59620 RepID=UPI00262744AC|nr:CooT family nickel-binding protein [uncultured Clostridium sp.]